MKLYVPLPNLPGGQYQAVPVQTVSGNEGSMSSTTGLPTIRI